MGDQDVAVVALRAVGVRRPGLTVAFEPRPGGRIHERTSAGVEHEWGEVIGFANEIQTLLVAGSRGYARLLRHDEARRVMLQERLGRPLGLNGPVGETQIAVICATLREAWIPAPAGVTLPSAPEKAAWLAEFAAVRRLRSRNGQPGPW